jgi:hypothetical protein
MRRRGPDRDLGAAKPWGPVHLDALRQLCEVTRKTFTAMIESVRGPALAAGLSDAESFDAGIRDLDLTAEPDGVFCYTFFKGVGETAR